MLDTYIANNLNSHIKDKIIEPWLSIMSDVGEVYRVLRAASKRELIDKIIKEYDQKLRMEDITEYSEDDINRVYDWVRKILEKYEMYFPNADDIPDMPDTENLNLGNFDLINWLEFDTQIYYLRDGDYQRNPVPEYPIQ